MRSTLSTLTVESAPLVRLPHRIAVALPPRNRVQKLLPGQLRLTADIAPEAVFNLFQKMLEMLGDRDYLRLWV